MSYERKRVRGSKYKIKKTPQKREKEKERDLGCVLVLVVILGQKESQKVMTVFHKVHDSKQTESRERERKGGKGRKMRGNVFVQALD